MKGGKAGILALAFCLFFATAFFAVSGAAPLNPLKGWHPLQQITTTVSGTTSVDANDNWVIDNSEACMGAPDNICDTSSQININGGYALVQALGNDLQLKAGAGRDILLAQESGGNVGIGMDMPTRKLDVTATDQQVGAFRFNTASTSTAVEIFTMHALTSGAMADGFGGQFTFRSGSTGFDGYLAGRVYTKRNGADSNHDIVIEPSGSSGITIRYDGKVGIGTTAPSDKLDVSGYGSFNNQVNIREAGQGWAQVQSIGSGLELKADANDIILNTPNDVIIPTGKDLCLGTDCRNAWPSGGSSLPTGNTGWTLRHDGSDWIAGNFLYNNGTNIGIGTPNPSQKLDVAGYVKGTGLCINGDCRSAWPAGGLGLPSGSAGQTLRHNGTDWVANSVLYNDGTNIGIGTSGPAGKLHVSQNSPQEALIVNQAGTGPIADFMDGGASALRINDGGNVGIGTTTPQRRLHIVGTDGPVTPFPTVDAKDWLLVENYGNSSMNIISNDNSSGALKFTDNGSASWRGAVAYDHITDAMWLGTAGSERLRITNIGRVGIGLNNPNTMLDVAGWVTLDNNIFIDGVYGKIQTTNINADLDITTVGMNKIYLNRGGGNVVVGGPSSGGGITSKLFVNAGGLANSPGSQLDVARFYGTTNNEESLRFFLQRQSGLNALWRLQRQVNLIDMGYMEFGDYGDNLITFGEGTTEYMRIDGSGNVGIGTTTPKSMLDVRGNLNIQGPNNAAVIYFPNNPGWGAPNLYIRSDDNPSTYEPASERLIITNTGKVGIGTTAPTATLHVAGDARITDLVSCNTIDTDASGNLKCGTDAGEAGLSCTMRNQLTTFQGAQWGISSSCIAGEIATGGGCNTVCNDADLIYSKFGGGQSWDCYYERNICGGAQIEAQVMCCKLM